ncbi:hypothetical protein [Flavobacterium sp. 7A]|uniref:hypothetical protein n=1 Tax=Flavobacterium sp. 7A TaxID=2940571 RepID=UPI0022263E2F|nr:hypothetical protein [Flavobacterium sp. 7A]MCW2119280.1 hypothetical protein [Flavobacterium sp. 7A]
MKKNKLLLTLIFMVTCSAYSQVKESEVFSKNLRGKAEHINFNQTKINSDDKSVKDFLRKQFDSRNDDDFRLDARNTQIENNLESKKYQQFYKGLKVEYAVQSIVSEKGNLKTLVGKYVDVSNINTTTKLSESQALTFALANIGAKSYMWEDKKMKTLLKKKRTMKKRLITQKQSL